MARARRTRAEQEADTAAERRVHGAILGYQPYRMKPVHFATSFLLEQIRFIWVHIRMQ